MKYDIAMKRLAELGGASLYRHLLPAPLSAAEILEELPQETVSLKRSDAAARIRVEGKDSIAMWEFLTYWDEEKPWDMLIHGVKYERRYGLNVYPILVLLNPHEQCRADFECRWARFRLEVVRPWEIEAENWLRENPGPALLAMTPLLRGGVGCAVEVERRLLDSTLPPGDKGDLLTIFTTFLGLRDAELAEYIKSNCGRLMSESPIYQSILEEGRQKGIEKGREEGEQKGMLEAASALKMAVEFRFGPEGYELFPLIDGCRNLERFAELRGALRTASVSALKDILSRA